MTHPAVLDETLSPAAIGNLAASFNVSRNKVQRATSELYNALAQRIERNTLSRGGVADVVALLGDVSAGRAADNPTQLASPNTIAAGNRVLDVLIGDKHVSRGIAAKAARRSGLDVNVVKNMLPAVASLVVGALQKQAAPALAEQLRAFPGIGDMLPMPGAPASRPQPAEAPRPAGNGAGGTGGARGGGVILPMPGDSLPKTPRRTPYDDLSDVIRKGGGGSAPGGGSLANIIRSILAGLLGYKNRGVIGSLIYMFLARFGMNLLRRILGRVFGGR